MNKKALRSCEVISESEDDDQLSEIADKLRAAFDDILKEPIPEEYIKLLDELEQKERSKK